VPAAERFGEADEDVLQRIDVEEHDEQQEGVQRGDDPVVQRVAAEEVVMLEPDVDEDEEADAEGNDAAHHLGQFVERFRRLERDD